eukprot:363620-Chlamydomonas_euryale.AAC.4
MQASSPLLPHPLSSFRFTQLHLHPPCPGCHAGLQTLAFASTLQRHLPGRWEARSQKQTARTKMATLDKRIGFIGAGQMAEALARGLMARGMIKGSQVRACGPPRTPCVALQPPARSPLPPAHAMAGGRPSV